MTHPYRGLPSCQFWSAAVADVAPHELDPVVGSPLRLTSEDRVATMGSCFAQHISRHLHSSGINYLVTEAGDGLTVDERRRRNFGVFTARYGNVYTVRQAVQLFDRAFGDWSSAEAAWQRDGAFVDPFRPQVEPEGFVDEALMRTDQTRHLAAVRAAFTDATVLVFTLGLTEGWRARRDGSVFPLAPGVAGGEFAPDRYEFVNFGIDEVVADLHGLVDRFQRVNPAGQMLLTISPVPLIATFEPRHVLVSTVYSKSVLRVAAEEAVKAHPGVHYFPSYELITAGALGGRYYADDLREVTELGVDHVMRVFSDHLLASDEQYSGGQQGPAMGEQADAGNDDIVCDEEEIERAWRQGSAATRHV